VQDPRLGLGFREDPPGGDEERRGDGEGVGSGDDHDECEDHDGEGAILGFHPGQVKPQHGTMKPWPSFGDVLIQTWLSTHRRTKPRFSG